MSYAAKDGKDTVVFVDKDYVDSQKEETVPSQQEKAADQEQQGEEKDQSAAYDPETGEINWDCPCKICTDIAQKGMSNTDLGLQCSRSRWHGSRPLW